MNMEIAEAKPGKAVRRAKIVALVVLVLLVAGAGRTLFVRLSNARALQAETSELARIYVKVGTPTVGGAATTLTLPGSLQGAVQSPIAARASGYLKRWTRDIGSRVEKGELLAEIESPEIDQQLSQAVAARQQAEAALALARSTLARWEDLRRTGMVAQQQVDERRSAEAQAVASLAAAEANVERLRQLQAFKRISAPFSGVITRRNVDVGDLIDAGGARPLFVLTQTDPLRVASRCRRPTPTWCATARRSAFARRSCAAASSRGRLPAPRARSMRARAPCRSRSSCRTATARCCPAPTCRYRYRCPPPKAS